MYQKSYWIRTENLYLAKIGQLLISKQLDLSDPSEAVMQHSGTHDPAWAFWKCVGGINLIMSINFHKALKSHL